MTFFRDTEDYGMHAYQASPSERDVEGTDNGKENGKVESDAKDDSYCCLACAKKFDSKHLAKLPCGYAYCNGCLEYVFRRAMRDETAYPPRCCYHTISLKTVRRHLPNTLVRDFREKQLELATKDKIYCHKPTCSAFIAPHSIHNGQAICQRCGAGTCSKCRAEWHFGPCTGGVDKEFVDFAISNK